MASFNFHLIFLNLGENWLQYLNFHNTVAFQSLFTVYDASFNSLKNRFTSIPGRFPQDYTTVIHLLHEIKGLENDCLFEKI